MRSCLVCRFFNQVLKPCKKGISKQGFEQLRNDCPKFAPKKVIVYTPQYSLRKNIEEIRRKWYNDYDFNKQRNR